MTWMTKMSKSFNTCTKTQKNRNDERKIKRHRWLIGRGTDSLTGFLGDKNKEAGGKEIYHRNN